MRTAQVAHPPQPAEAVAKNASAVACKQTCPTCTGGELRDFLLIRDLPVHICVLAASPEEAVAATRGDILLTQCQTCGHIFNRRYEAEKVRFDPDYEASLEHSETFRQHIHSVAHRLIEQYDLHSQRIVEVGCGSGYFLRKLCELGGNDCVGFDPSVVEPGLAEVSRGSLKLLRQKYRRGEPAGIDPTGVPCEFLCCLSVIEGIEKPLRFLREVREVLGERTVAGYFEIFNGERPFTRDETFSIHYEQCNYFTRRSFAKLIELSGFEILQAGTCYEVDQYLYIDARTAAATPLADRNVSAGKDELNLQAFAAALTARIDRWERWLADRRDSPENVVLWGSGGKGISFLNMLPTSGVIDFVVDINPRRQGMFIPGSGQQIIAPAALVEIQPKTVLVSNPLYTAEIRQQLLRLGIDCELVAI